MQPARNESHALITPAPDPAAEVSRDALAQAVSEYAHAIAEKLMAVHVEHGPDAASRITQAFGRSAAALNHEIDRIVDSLNNRMS
jgi:hypothetical protein